MTLIIRYNVNMYKSAQGAMVVRLVICEAGEPGYKVVGWN